jgi:hypothetical protein
MVAFLLEVGVVEVVFTPETYSMFGLVSSPQPVKAEKYLKKILRVGGVSESKGGERVALSFF